MNTQTSFVEENGGGLTIITDTYDDFGALIGRHRRVIDWNASLDDETDEIKQLALKARENANLVGFVP